MALRGGVLRSPSALDGGEIHRLMAEWPIDEDERMAIKSLGAQCSARFLNVSTCLKRIG
ncbi:hypothetical protein IVB14_20545 [Bradyrhizobium sp. 180]|uniref:hypothetical protein n=1 Tax=unclassified Bradyrhizobium TaxID=2631580 RepID=UPI001FF97770|nr:MULTISPECIES: hypothetical protein [unclassified Bradyrhizobium]MCK1422120.1 hypothetical protein [Bradyrhizobium sp. CW12]MCK1492745.1 hypothetical protein [Bradyrhizobium sp. 180]MCK1528871.1 hypothetical protein [Bradyrhizobium sp. 182]MCK1598048.1 hypothetical protein [Bradyrhizobium sp. 164]MCK1620070.1 hypothetical protein [Bradyrhizobium sp. 159]